jgi:hypothetical protein
MMSLREKLLFNGSTIYNVPAIKPRKPVVLCEGKICEIQRYIGVHCNPTSKRRSCWQYCLVATIPATGESFRKIILERENNTLLFKLPPYHDGSILSKLIHICFSMRNEPLISIRSRAMLNTGVFIYDSMRRLFEDMEEHFSDCSSYRIVLTADLSTFR